MPCKWTNFSYNSRPRPGRHWLTELCVPVHFPGCSWSRVYQSLVDCFRVLALFLPEKARVYAAIRSPLGGCGTFWHSNSPLKQDIYHDKLLVFAEYVSKRRHVCRPTKLSTSMSCDDFSQGSFPVIYVMHDIWHTLRSRAHFMESGGGSQEQDDC